MFHIPQSTLNEFKTAYNNHLLYVNTCNIYHHTIRMIRNKHTILNMNDYDEYYRNILNDIELVTIPIDAFIPNDNPTADHRLFLVNRDVTEYEKIKKRVNLDDIFATFPATHNVSVKLKENPNLLETVTDDVFIYYCVVKYAAQIELLRLQDISEMKQVIEYVVEHLSLQDMKGYLERKKIDEAKCVKYWEDIMFMPDLKLTHQFYESETHEGFEPFSVVDLIKRFMTNLVLKSDIYIISAIYLILTFSKVDIMEQNYDDSPCAKYVRDVLSKL